MLRTTQLGIGIGSTIALAFACQGNVGQTSIIDLRPMAGAGGGGAGALGTGGMVQGSGGAFSGAGGIITTSGSGGIAGTGGTGGGVGTCAPDQLSCNGACVVPASDNANCGNCGTVCPAGSSCVSGACTCPSGAPPCATGCADLTSDPVNCGVCGTSCGNGMVCSASSCQCQPGQTACSSGCVDTTSDFNNCGGCGTICPQGQVCSQSQCGLVCAGGETQCGQSCVNLTNNPAHCGSCNNACTGGRECASSTCDCPGALEFCNNACIDVTENDSNCGSCGTVCTGGRSCNASQCTCSNGQQYCNNQCRTTATDPAHCGGCNIACAQGQTCNNGSCVCPQGQTSCGGACVNTSNNASHCGSCNNSCASGSCSNGTCTPVQTGSTPVGWCMVNGTTTGGKGGSVVQVDTASELNSALNTDSARIIQVTANISGTFELRDNKTLVGMNNNITISGGLSLDGVSNVIIQNLKINGASSNANGDGINIQGSDHIWIDHCEIYDAPDGNMDITNGSNYICVSWTKFRYSSNGGDHRYSNLIGSGDGVTSDENLLNITWHHNWWANNVHERMPRVRFGDVHVFNNYYSSSGNNYCIRAGFHSKMVVENNHFQGVDTPHELGEDQGTAQLVASGNIYNSTGATQTRGSAFNPSQFYSYTLDPASSVSAAVQAGAGPRPTPP